MKAATATGAASMPALLAPPIINGTGTAGRCDIHVHRQARAGIVWQHRFIVASLILVRDPIAGEMILVAVHGPAAADFALIVLVVVVTRAQPVADDCAKRSTGRRRGHTSVAGSDLSTEQTARHAADDRPGERVAAMTHVLGHILGI